MIKNLEEIYKYNQHFVAMMNIINTAKLNPPAKGHKHHIVPKCWFKLNNLPVDNSNDNLVLLTIEDHIKVHKLSILCANNSTFKAKMTFAYHRLSKRGTSTHISGIKFSEEHKKKLSESHKGIKFSEEHRKNISLAMIGRPSWNANMSGHYKEHLNMDEIIKSYYKYKLTALFPISWNCYQSYYHKGEI